MRPVLRPGGVLAIAFSDRWFPTKAITVWSRLPEFERLALVLHLLCKTGFPRLQSETQRGLAQLPDDDHIANRSHADPLFAARGYPP